MTRNINLKMCKMESGIVIIKWVNIIQLKKPHENIENGDKMR